MKNTHFVTRSACPCCLSTDSKTLYTAEYTKQPLKKYLEDFYNPQGGVEFEYLENANFVVSECNQCSMVYQKDIPGDFLMKKLYDEWIDPVKVVALYDNNHRVDYYVAYARFLFRLLNYFNQPSGQLKFFDFGMGWAQWCMMVKGFGIETYGAELSEARIKAAREKGVKVISWDEIPQHQFDYINTDQVFEHLPRPLETLQYLAKALKPGGLLRISVPNGSDIKKRMTVMNWEAPKFTAESLNAIAPLEHINCFNYRAMVKMAETAGFEPVHLPVYPQLNVTERAPTTREEVRQTWSNLKSLPKKLLRPLYWKLTGKQAYQYIDTTTTDVVFRKKQ